MDNDKGEVKVKKDYTPNTKEVCTAKAFEGAECSGCCCLCDEYEGCAKAGRTCVTADKNIGKESSMYEAAISCDHLDTNKM